MTTSLLNVIATEQSAEPLELPRLATAQIFAHYGRIGKALENAVAAFKHLPESTPKMCDDNLLEIAKQCDVASKTAMRLLEANR